MSLVRTWLPLVIVAGGIISAIVAPDRIEASILIISAGLSVWLLNWFFRLGVAGDRERVEEERAREYFERHGRWPDDR